MAMNVFRLSSILVLVVCIARADYSTRDRVYQNMALAGTAGALYGFSRPDYKNNYAILYGAVGAALASAITLYFFDPDVKSSSLSEENKRLKSLLDDFEKRNDPKLFQQGNSLFYSTIPKEVSGLVDPGEWKRYKMDQWVQDPNQSNIWYRQVEMFEIIPPVSR